MCVAAEQAHGIASTSKDVAGQAIRYQTPGGFEHFDFINSIRLYEPRIPTLRSFIRPVNYNVFGGSW